MARSPEDALFAHFRRHGDPKSLAGVFDLTAAELLRVACHLVAQRATAEDLVQGTFVAAIEKAAAFDERRPVLPWLLGILANRAGTHRREERRKLDERALRDSVEDPEANAAGEEFRLALAQALRELPAAYRQVMVLHLQHGLSAREIGAALDRPAGTIRTYVVRGMEHLRRALPAGFAAGATAATNSGRGLDAVRAAVLGRAQEFTGAAASIAGVSVLGVVIAMKKSVLVACAVALVAVGAALIPLITSAKDAGHGTGGDQVAAAPSPASRGTSAELQQPSPLERRRESAETPQSVPATGSLLVRVLHAPEETAVEDVGVTVGDSPVLAEGRTEADGTALFDGLRPGRVAVRTDRGATSGAEVRAGERTEFLVRLANVTTLTGQVVDQEGQPVARAAILYLDWQIRHRDSSGLLGHTDRAGRFAFRAMQGQKNVWAAAPGLQPSAMADWSGDLKTHTVKLIVGPAGHRLEGRVLDPAGAAVPRAPVAIALRRLTAEAMGFKGYRHESFATYPVRTDAEGRFAVDWVPEGELLLLGKEPGFAPKRRTLVRCSVVADVVNRVELRLRELPAVHGTLRDPNGTPIADEHVSAFWRQSDFSPLGSEFTDDGLTVTAKDGTFRIAGLLCGRYQLTTHVQNNSVERGVELVEGQDLQWDPVLDRGRPSAVRVVDEAGRPCPGWRVTWRSWAPTDGKSRPKQLGMAADGKTDEAGRARAEGLKDDAYWIVVHAPLPIEQLGRWRQFDPFPTCVKEDVRPGTVEIEIRVPKDRMPSVFLKGRVLGPDGNPMPDARIAWHRTDWLHGDGSPSLLPDPRTGRFEFGPLAPGTFRLWVGSETYAGMALEPRVALPDQVLDFGDLRLQAPAFIEVSVKTTAGSAVKQAKVLCGTRQEPAAGWSLDSKEGTDLYRSRMLPPGTYVICAFTEDLAPVRREVTVTEGQEERIELTLEPGAACTLDLLFPGTVSGIASAVLRLRDANGNAVLEERVWGYFNDLATFLVRRKLSLAPGTYSVEVQSADYDLKGKGTATFAVPPGGLADPVKVQLR